MLLCDGRRGCSLCLWTMSSAIQIFSGCCEVWDWTWWRQKNNQRLTRMERNRMKLFLTQRRDAQHSCRYIEQRHPNTLKARLWDSTDGFSNFYTSFTDLKAEVTPVHWIKGKRSLNIIVLSKYSIVLSMHRTNFLSLFFLKQEGPSWGLKPSQLLCFTRF